MLHGAFGSTVYSNVRWGTFVTFDRVFLCLELKTAVCIYHLQCNLGCYAGKGLVNAENLESVVTDPTG